MIFEDDHGPMDGSDDLVAAEYVVGALSAEERRQVALRIERDPGFARLVEAWEGRLSPLADDYPEVEPPAAAKQVADESISGAYGVAANAGPANLATALLPGKENAGWGDSRFSRRWPPGAAGPARRAG